MSAGNAATALLGCTHPIVLAGMGGPSRAALVGAVTAAGGFGFLGMVREPPALIRQDVEALRRTGHERFGVNIIPAATAPELLAQQLDTIIGLRVPVVALFWDLDAAVVKRLRDAGIIVVYQVGSADEAIAAERAGASLIIAQGREAGGHVRGTTPLRELLPAVVAAVDVPVLAAGGLGTGGDLVIAQALGADGVVLGTRLLASEESYAHPHHKRRLLAAGAEDTLLTDMFHINWPPGAPVRVLTSAVTAGARGPDRPEAPTVIGEEAGRPIYLFSTDSPLQSMTGDFEAMALYAGTGVGAVTAIAPAAEIVREIVAEAAVEPIAGAEHAVLSSPACSLAEVTGAYAGQLDAAEIAIEVAALRNGLRALLAETLAADRTLGETPPFTATALPLAQWIMRLTPFAAPHGARPAPGDGRANLLTRLGRLIPQLPEDGLRTALAVLREWLDRDTR